jgi:hypothetical protein
MSGEAIAFFDSASISQNQDCRSYVFSSFTNNLTKVAMQPQAQNCSTFKGRQSTNTMPQHSLTINSKF